MPPDSSHHDPAAPPVLPPVAGQTPVGQAMPMPVPAQAPVPGMAAATDPVAVMLQAKQLVAQYSHDPFYLSNALQQLKQGYLADHFHITPKSAEN